MASGGIEGRVVVIDGKTGGDPGPATVAVLNLTSKLASPQSGRFAFARSLRIRNLDATNNLLLYVDDQAPITLSQGEAALVIEATVSKIAVAANAATTQYEILAVVAA